MNKYRKEINKIDNQIIELLSKRFENAIEIAKVKKNLDIPIFDEERENQLMDLYVELLKEDKNKEEIINVFKYIINVSKDIQKKV